MVVYARAVVLSVQFFRTGRSDSARQRLVKPAEHRIGHDLRFPFLQPSPFFCPCRLHLGPLDCPVRLEPWDDRIDPIPDPFEFFSLPGQPQVFAARPAFSPTAFATCSPSTRRRRRALALTPRCDGAVRRIVRLRESCLAAATPDTESRLIGNLGYEATVGAKGAGFDRDCNRYDLVCLGHRIHDLITLLNAGVE